MSRKLNSKYPLVNDPEEQDPGTPPENAPDSPVSGDDTRAATTTGAPSPKKIKRGVQKRVVSVPIGDVEGSRSKGEGYPATDSWAWRKYGQKPIKGSPYPRGYYRCSSSKGCPARKQVERSRVDPTTMVITYAFDHNHPLPPTKHHHHHHHLYSSFSAGVVTSPQPPPADDHLLVFTNQAPDEKYPELGCGDPLSLAAAAEFCWFSDVVSPTVLESPVLGPSCHVDAEMAGVYSMGTEEDESLFADLGELPEFSVVFRQSFLELNDTAQRCSLAASLCGSTG